MLLEYRMRSFLQFIAQYILCSAIWFILVIYLNNILCLYLSWNEAMKLYVNLASAYT